MLKTSANSRDPCTGLKAWQKAPKGVIDESEVVRNLETAFPRDRAGPKSLLRVTESEQMESRTRVLDTLSQAARMQSGIEGSGLAGINMSAHTRTDSRSYVCITSGLVGNLARDR